MSRSGADLALLLLGGFRSLVDAATAELARRGYEDVRPVHDFAMRAIAAGAGNASELGRRLSVSKQAAAKTIAVRQERRSVTRGTAPRHARRMRLQVTPLGFEVLRQGEAIFDELRDQWERQIGSAELESLETHRAALVGGGAEVDGHFVDDLEDVLALADHYGVGAGVPVGAVAEAADRVVADRVVCVGRPARDDRQLCPVIRG